MRGPLDSRTRLMSPEEFSRRTYCSVAETVSFDPVTSALSIHGSVTNGGKSTPIQVMAAGVTQFHWAGRPKLPGGFFELSTVEIQSEGSGWLVEFEPWHSSTLRFACEVLELNGERIQGEGAWYQDSLGGPVPLKKS
jgi:hypothetical protein